MTNLSLRNLNGAFDQINRVGIGFDHVFDRLDEIMRITSAQNSHSYPPYNLIKHTDNSYTIELAVAGFKQGDIDIEVKENNLIVSGKKNVLPGDVEFVHRGISNREFQRVFTLAEHVEVLGANQENGILSIHVERQVPEEKKPKKIAIAYSIN